MELSRIFRRVCLNIYTLFNQKLFHRTVLYGLPRIINKKRLKIGFGVTINPNVFIHADGGVIIGNNVTLSYGTSIITTGLDTSNWSERIIEDKADKQHVSEPISIGNNVWICANVTVLPGVNIADNCIIAAGSVVISDLLDENTIYAGIPAKKVKELN